MIIYRATDLGQLYEVPARHFTSVDKAKAYLRKHEGNYVNIDKLTFPSMTAKNVIAMLNEETVHQTETVYYRNPKAPERNIG